MLTRFTRFLAGVIVGDDRPPDPPPPPSTLNSELEERFMRLESLLLAQSTAPQPILDSQPNNVLSSAFLTPTQLSSSASPVLPFSTTPSSSARTLDSAALAHVTAQVAGHQVLSAGPLGSISQGTQCASSPLPANGVVGYARGGVPIIASHLGLARPPPPPPSPPPPVHAPGGWIASHVGLAHPVDDFISDYPQGRFQRTALLSSNAEVQALSYNKWPWRSIGNRSHHGLLAEVRKCLGIILCTNAACGRPVRPRTQPASRLQQLAKNCVACGSPLRQVQCDCRTYRYPTTLNEEQVMVWEHDGYHLHPHPPPPSVLSRQERAILDNQVSRNPTASAHQLRTGSILPGSIPLHQISNTLTNPAAARYQVAQSMNRLGIPSASSQKGGFSLLSALVQLNEDQRFIVDASLAGPVYISFQTPFMEQVLSEAMEDWIEEDVRADGRHGMVSDGSHSFFREGELLTSSIFSAVTLGWLPALFTWILGRDTEHHIPHFDRIAKQIVAALGSKFDRKHLLHVMDFSLTQRKAHAIAYANTCIEALGPVYKQLDKAVQDRQFELLVKEAEAVEIGCEVHFERSLIRVRKTAAIVNPDLASRFENLIRILRGRNTTITEFDEAKQALLREFPRLKSWISWWMDQPKVASMIFPAKSFVDPAIRDQVPSTSNPVEHQHSLLNHATGTQHDLIPGAKLLLKHVQELEAQYTAIKQGVYDPLAPRQPMRPRPPKPFDNDGRAPDTVDALKKPLLLTPLSLMSYSWVAPNSCFIDASQELWYQAQLVMDDSVRQRLLLLFPSGSFMSGLWNHFMRRNRLVDQFHGVTNPESVRKMVRELELGQVLAKQHIFDVWKLLPKGDYGCAVSWLQSAVRDNTGPSAQQPFGIQHVVVSRCAEGHVTNTHDPLEPIIVLNIEQSAATALQRHYGAGTTITFQHYLQHYIPRNRANGNHPVHTHPTSRPCVSPGCSSPSHVIQIDVVHPQYFNCHPQPTTNPTDDCLYPVNLVWPRSLSIKDVNGKGSVTYTLVGSVIHSVNHYTSRIWKGDTLYEYNDMDSSDAGYATLKPCKTDTAASSETPALYVYVKTSEKATTTRPVESLVSDLNMLSTVQAEISRHRFTVPNDDNRTEQAIPVPRPTKSKSTTSKSRKKTTPVAKPPKSKRSRGGHLQPRGRVQKSAGSKDKEERVIESEDEEGTVGQAQHSLAPPPHVEDARASLPNSEPELVEEDSDCGYVTMPFPDPLVPPPLNLASPLVPLPRCAPDACSKDEDEPSVECSLCHLSWHLSCVRSHASAEPGYEFDGVCEDWCCWECVESIDSSTPSRWDDLLLGQYILVDVDRYRTLPTGRPMWYPAVMHSRLGCQVQMLWHEGNLYEGVDSRPTSPFFTLHPLECVRAYQRVGSLGEDFMPTNSTSNGLIAMPWVLYPNAVDELGFRDDGLISALHRATPAILDVLRGARPSRVMALFKHWFKESKTKSSQDHASAAMFFSMAFTFPIFAAHSECIPPFLLYIETVTRNTTAFDSSHYAVVSHLASVLYRVVVARHHLGLAPQADESILLLAFNGPLPSFEPPLSAAEVAAAEGCLTRTPTIHEQAYSSSVPGVVDTHALPSLAAVGSLRRIPRETLQDVTITSSPIRAITPGGNDFDFSLCSDFGSGLELGGNTALPPIPQEFRALVTPHPTRRPVPRPVGRAATTRGLPQPVRLPPSELPTLDGSPLLDIAPPRRVLRDRAQMKARDPPSPPKSSIPAKKRKGSKSWYAYVDLYGNVIPSSDNEDGQ